MLNDSLATLGAWTVTYLAHSTLLLGAAWLLCRAAVIRSPSLRERGWKCASVTGVVTAALATFGGWGVVLFRSDVRTEATTKAVTFGQDPVRALVRSRERLALPVTDRSLATEPGQRAAVTSESGSTSTQPDGSANAIHGHPAFGVLSTDSFAWVNLDSEITAEEYAAIEARLLAEEAAAGPEPDSMNEQGAEIRVAGRRHISGTDAGAPADLLPRGERALRSENFLPDDPGGLPFLRVVGLIAGIWLAIGATRTAVRELSLRKLLQRTVAAPHRGTRLLASLAKHASVAPWRRVLGAQASAPTLLVSPDIFEPIACGLVRPRIILPTGCDERLPREELRALLAHELAHLLRGDVAWLWVGRVLCSSLGFQPLNFVARRRWQAESEILCDDWAVERDVSAVSLASCLTRVAQWRVDRRAMGELAATSTGGMLTMRIERLLAQRSPDAWRSAWRKRFSHMLAFAAGIAFAAIAPRLEDTAWGRSATSTSPRASGRSPDAGDAAANEADDQDVAARLAAWRDVTTEWDLVRRDVLSLEQRAASHPDADLRVRIQKLGSRFPPHDSTSAR